MPRDGSVVGRIIVRTLRAQDRACVAAALDRLSARSCYLRFGRPGVDPDVALAWMAELGGAGSVAVAGFDRHTGEGIGVARYVRSADRQAELAVTVLDAWQGRGGGGLLLDELLAKARTAGIACVEAHVLAENGPALSLMRRIGGRRDVESVGSMLHFRAELAPLRPDQPLISGMSCATASSA
jgi:RimJ/RimL family protein N-acetyltransferase